MTGRALLHAASPSAAPGWWEGWGGQPGVVVLLLITGLLYLRGSSALWRSAGAGHGVRRYEAAAFGVGWLTLALALASPLHGASERLFSAHMVQHELLMVVAAPLLVFGRPLLPLLWGLPPAGRRIAGSWASGPRVRAGSEILTHPAATWSLHAVAIWIWHFPPLYQAALERGSVHALQHASFVGTALLFWWVVLRRRGGRLGTPAAVILLFTTAVHTSLLGALLAFASRAWYPAYHGTAAAWGLTPLEDQQLAGMIMWVPPGLAYAAGALGLLATWLAEPSRAPRPGCAPLGGAVREPDSVAVMPAVAVSQPAAPDVAAYLYGHR